MNSANLSSTDPYSVLRVGEAWRNRPGMATLAITFFAATLLVMLGASGNMILLFLTSILAVLVYFAGLSAAGLQFMDQAAGRPVTPVLPAFLGSPMLLLRSFGLTVGLVVAFVVYLVVAAIVLFICKIPVLGTVLYAAALPVLTFVGALLLLGLTVAGMVSGAALWEGHSFSTAVSQGWAVSTQRPMQAFLSLIQLCLVVLTVSIIIAILVFAGFSVVGGLSTWILRREMAGDISSLMGAAMSGNFGGGHRGSGSAGGLLMAGMFGGAVIFMVVQTLFTAILMFGIALNYLNITSGLDISAARSAVDSVISKTMEKAQQAAAEAKRRSMEAQAAAQSRMERARAAPPVPAAAAPVAELACPACRAINSIEDVFCGGCGPRLR